MNDTKILDTNQVINGLAVLLSFFVGYKYALKRHDIKENEANKKEKLAASGLDVTEEQAYSSTSFNYKMVLVVRNDLKMGKGKIAAQCGHGAVGAFQKAARIIPSVVRAWENTGCAKIAVRVESEAELMTIKRSAEARNLITCLVRDAGRTQIEPNTKTVLAIGPAAVEAIDRVTGHLKLL